MPGPLCVEFCNACLELHELYEGHTGILQYGVVRIIMGGGTYILTYSAI